MVSPIYKLWLGIRSTLFWIVFLPSTLILGLFLSLMFFTPFAFRSLIIRTWIEINLFNLRWSCGLDYEIEGLENVPKEGFIIMSKHSSTWETIALQRFFRPLVWVVKRELTWIPVFGWALHAADAIALNRGTGRKAIQQLIDESGRMMAKGRILMLFPEGTRVPPKQTKPFKIGGAIVAAKTGYAVLPIAHNAGEFWPRHSWIKWPGRIRIIVGKPIDPQGRSPEAIIEEVSTWITNECERISDHAQLQRLGLS